MIHVFVEVGSYLKNPAHYPRRSKLSVNLAIAIVTENFQKIWGLGIEPLQLTIVMLLVLVVVMWS